MKERRKILVVCPTSWERSELAKPAQTDRFDFVLCCEELYESVGLINALRFDVRRYLDRIAAAHRGRGIVGVLGTGDYPGCMFSAYLAQQLGLPAPHPRDAVLLSHKHYSRQQQRRLAPEATPEFALVDPRSPQRPAGLRYPFFVKPVKGTMSIRAQMVHSDAELRRAVRLSLPEQLRSFMLLTPYAQLLKLYSDAPPPVRAFIAEAPLRGVQVTVDGFVQGGVSTVMGITDSIMYPGTTSFQRFEYPSSLPAPVQARMRDIVNRVMAGSGFNHSCYNVELFYDESQDSIAIIEINPRMSYQFSDLFEQVDGQSSFAVQLALATGEKVTWQPGAGHARAAASFVMRRFRDARVLSVPTRDQQASVVARFPGAHIKLLCQPGDRLSHHDQDVGSYRYCIVNMAAASRQALMQQYSDAESLLPFHFAE